MTTIRVSFPCAVKEYQGLDADPRPLTADEWRPLEGLSAGDESVLEHLWPDRADDGLIASLELEGGRLTLQQLPAMGMFGAFTFTAARALTAAELAALERVCHGQWWDGIGGSFSPRLAGMELIVEPGEDVSIRGRIEQTQ